MSEPLRVLVTGSRTCTEGQRQAIRASLDGVVDSLALEIVGRGITIVHGQCPYGGVDLVAHLWALNNLEATPEPHPADWARYGKAAGHIRNGEMVALGAYVCLAFPGPKSVGTWDCIRKAANAGIPTHIYPLKPSQ
jgi:hypothetical protein